MSDASSSAQRAPIEPLPANITSAQPGGGVCYRIELAWGRFRRGYLKRFRTRYVERMRQLRQGDAAGAAHEILDPRDLKFQCNQCDARWSPLDDPFRWRERIPFARWGLAELQLMGWPLAAATAGLACTAWWWAAIVPAVILGLIVYFFRDPPRTSPQGLGDIVSPADGKVVEVTEVEHDEFIGGPAVRIGIFLSIFNVHINRAALTSRVVRLRYSPGEFLSALRPESALRNENMWIGMEEDLPPYRRYVVRQISGQFARRIVCALRPGEVVQRGQKFGMIKLGSRTELILPRGPDLVVEARVGQKLAAGATVVARFVNAQGTP